MKVCVVGLWHLGTVTAACLADCGHSVCGLDFDEKVILNLQNARAPLFEPGLDALLKKGIDEGRLSFSTDPKTALAGSELVWVTYDTPVDENDQADVAFVSAQVKQIFPYLPDPCTVLVSSQAPVGTIRKLADLFTAQFPGKQVGFACSPENLRLGKAIQVFMNPDRVVVGVRSEADRKRIETLLSSYTERIEWMSVEAAEMTKHAINAFLATSVTFINEIATICENVGVDAKEVERGLKSESRIGPKAYLGPGGAFAGGTLARDIVFLKELGQTYHLPVYLINAVLASNQEHKSWPRRRLMDILQEIKGKTIAIWGLTYKPGTDTLRRSTAVELCRWLSEQGACIQAHDPAVKQLPDDLARTMKLFASPIEAAQGADALVVATEWPDYLSVTAQALLESMKTAWVVDANRFLGKTLGVVPAIRYLSVGKEG
jgi:UDPglucose 6-dehydrogenase